ncbi:MAG: CRTAC1 family protein [Planctomycetes bacterium]|nr:CRTAC1 family protein [Planctomycetota bacterium]
MLRPPARTALTLAGLSICGPLAVNASAQGPKLVEVTKNSNAPDYCGVNFIYHLADGKEAENMGAAVGDYNNDGFDDLFFAQGKTKPNALYKNNGNGTFTDVAATAKVDDPAFPGAGGLFLDYDNDGDLDLFVAGHPGNVMPTTDIFRLFENLGGPNYKFANVTVGAKFALDMTTAKGTSGGFLGGMCAGDYNRDGYLDICTTYWQANNGQDQMRLFRSDVPPPGSHGSKRVFTDVTKASMLDLPWPGEMWQCTFVDLNRDGWLDIHICMDFDLDLYLKGSESLTFTDVATTVGLNGDPPMGNNEMGSAFGDFDNDGDLDVHKTDMMMMMKGNDMPMGGDKMYKNDTVAGNMMFMDVAMDSMLDMSEWGWGDIFMDIDNDGDLDHATVSGFKDGPWMNTLQINEFPMMGKMMEGPMFMDMSMDPAFNDFTKAGKLDWRSARGLTWIDYDNDGDVDLVVSTHGNDGDIWNVVPNEKYGVFKNLLQENGSMNHWMDIRLKRNDGSLNVANTRIAISSNGMHQMREILVGTSEICQEPDRQHFGLGTATSVDWMCIRYPDGILNVIMNPPIDQTNTYTKKRTTCVGDMDGDGLVNEYDFWLFMILYKHPAMYHSIVGNYPGEECGDVNGDGSLTDYDWYRMGILCGLW